MPFETTTARPAGARRVTDAQLAAIAETIQAVGGYTSELASLIRGQQANSVLWSGTVRLDAAGAFTIDFSVPYASVAIWPASTGGALTILVDAPMASPPPTDGPGVFVIPLVAATEVRGRCFPALGRSLTIVGTPGAIAGMLAVFSRVQPPV